MEIWTYYRVKINIVIYWGYNNGFWLVFFYNSGDEHIIYAINDSSRKTAFDRDVGGYILTHTD